MSAAQKVVYAKTVHVAEKHMNHNAHENSTEQNNGNQQVVENVLPQATVETRRRCSEHLIEQKDRTGRSDRHEGKIVSQINDDSAGHSKRKKLSENLNTQLKSLVVGKMDIRILSSNEDDEIQEFLHNFKFINDSKVQKLRKQIIQILELRNCILYRCNICFLHFLKETDWRKHLRAGKHNATPLTCNDCKLNFSYNSSRKHFKMHQEGINSFYVISDIIFSTPTNNNGENVDLQNIEEAVLNPNFNKDSVEFPIESDDNPKSNTNGLKTLLQQEEMVSNETRDITNNKMIPHQKEIPEHDETKKSAIMKLFKCDTCDLHYINKNTWHHHLNYTCKKYKQKIGRYIGECTSCDMTFPIKVLYEHEKVHELYPSITKFDFHIKSRQSMMKEKENEKMKLFKCKSCDLHFIKYSTWWQHLKHRCKNSHTYKERLNIRECPKCKVLFHKRAWIQHMKIHASNTSITKNDFVIKCRPKNRTNKLLPQSNDVPTAEKVEESHAINEKVKNNIKDILATRVEADSTMLSQLQLQEKDLNANNNKNLLTLKQAIESELNSKILKVASALSNDQVIDLNNIIASVTNKEADKENKDQHLRNSHSQIVDVCVPDNECNINSSICDNTSANTQIEKKYSKGLQFEDSLEDIVEIDESYFEKSDESNICYQSDDSQATVILDYCEPFEDLESKDEIGISANENKSTKEQQVNRKTISNFEDFIVQERETTKSHEDPQVPIIHKENRTEEEKKRKKNSNKKTEDCPSLIKKAEAGKKKAIVSSSVEDESYEEDIVKYPEVIVLSDDEEDDFKVCSYKA